VPVFHSLPGSADTLYLDFDGQSATDVWGTYTALAYDLNSNPTQWSPGERLAIFNVWRVTSEDYSSFNIDVTTATPGTVGYSTGFRQLITNSPPSIVGAESNKVGIAWNDSYAANGAPGYNTAWTFAANFPNYGGDTGAAASSSRIMAVPLEIGTTTSH